jgi:hypothetical protein
LFSTIITIGFLIRNAISMGVKISLGNNEWTCNVLNIKS